VIRIILEIDGKRHKKRRIASWGFTVSLPATTQPRKISFMSNKLELTIHTSETATFGLAPLDNGTPPKPFVFPAGVVPVWTVSAGTIKPVVAADGLTAVIDATDSSSDNVIDITVPGQISAQLIIHCDVVVPPAPVIGDWGLTLISRGPKGSAPAPTPVKGIVTG
jgi:hypothetical protein